MTETFCAPCSSMAGEEIHHGPLGCQLPAWLPAWQPASETPQDVTREALSAVLKRRGMTEREVQDVLGELGTVRPDIDQDPMWHRAYMDVEAVLNQALGSEEEDGLGSGVAADVALLAQQRDEARAKLAAITDACRSIPTPIAQRLLAIIGSEEKPDA